GLIFVPLHVALVKTLGETPGIVSRPGAQQRKKQSDRKAARQGVKKIQLDLGEVVKAVVKNPAELLEKIRRGRELRFIRDRLAAAELLKSPEQDQKIGGALAGAPAEMAFAERVQGDPGIDQPVAQIAQSLPERGAAAGAVFEAGEGLGAGPAPPDDLAERFFEEKIAL